MLGDPALGAYSLYESECWIVCANVVCLRMLYVREFCVQGKVLCVCEYAGVNVVCIEV